MTPPRAPTIAMAIAALAGLSFNAWSTSDFVQHLDRQVHAIHCSFVPGMGIDASGSTGCHVALMSPWSSVFRQAIWGGLPITLPGMAVFAYLLWRAVHAWGTGRERERALAGFLVAAWALPVLTSCFYGYIALTELGALCKLCVGTYTSSGVGFVAALVGWWGTKAPTWSDDDELAPSASQASVDHALRFGEGVLFVTLPVALYAVLAPDFSEHVGSCGALIAPKDPYGVLVPIGHARGGKPAIEVLDPLCPACAGMEDRLAASGLGDALDRRALLFPLDSSCNWMVHSEIHPGACAASEAVLCAGDRAHEVLAWTFAHGEEVRATGDGEAATRLIEAAFPELAACIGSADARQRLNQSLRWAVANRLPVLTPQLYVDGTKLCDDDTDLGLDWALSRLLARSEAK